jgi:hypothetical protein
MAFFIRRKLLIRLSVQMYRQIGYSEQGLVDLDKSVLNFVIFSNQNSASNRQISIEPGVPNTAAVALNADL